MAGTALSWKNNGDSDQRGRCDFGRRMDHGRPGSSGPKVDGAGRAVGFQVCMPRPASHRCRSGCLWVVRSQTSRANRTWDELVPFPMQTCDFGWHVCHAQAEGAGMRPPAEARSPRAVVATPRRGLLLRYRINMLSGRSTKAKKIREITLGAA